MPEVIVKEVLANILVTLPTAGFGIYFAKKLVDQIISRMDRQDDSLVKLREVMVGKPLHESEMEAHAKRMDSIELKSRDDESRRDALLGVVRETIEKKADELGLVFVREDVKEIKNDVSIIKDHLLEWKNHD